MADQCFAIVSPYQGTPLNEVARLSLARTAEVMSRHRWIFALPEGTDLVPLKEVCGDIEARFFDPGFFESKKTAQLFYMLPELYEAFSDFDYILIHQPDVYVFEDRLDEWMKRMADNNWDYIGAPWFDHQWLRFAKNPIARLPWHWLLREKVGSGGFSIRTPKKFARIARRNRALITRLASFVPEDIWWCQLAQFFGEPIKRPSVETAANFAFETECERCLELNSRQMPFAVHGWNRHEWDFWRDRIPGAAEIYDDLVSRGIRPI